MMFRIMICFLVMLLVLPTLNGLASIAEAEGQTSSDDEMWSKCNCPASLDEYDASNVRPPSARMAYLISVHNKRTLSDGAYLLKALMETAYPGDIAIILIHVDKRVGIASREDSEENNDEKEKNQYLYYDSPLRKYIDACHATPACTRYNDRRDAMNTKSTFSKSNSNNNSNATILEVHSHFAPEWSKWSMNDPTIWAMDYLTHHNKLNNNNNRQSTSSSSWDVFVNLSGDTLPVISASRISQLFHHQYGPLGNTNFVTSASCVTGLLPTSIYDFPKHTMKRGHYFQHNIPKTLSYIDDKTGQWMNDIQTPIYFGSQWMALTHDFVEYVIRSMDHPNGLGNVLKETLIETGVLMTDETFFATMLMNSPYNNTIPQLNDDGALTRYPSMHSLRYERMDENLPNAWGKYTSSNPLYDIPTKFGDVTNGEGPAKAWGPYFLGVYDLGNIRDSGALFVRKVSWTVDKNLVRLLPVKETSLNEEGMLEWDVLPDIRWPELGVTIHDPFVWRALKEEGEEEEEE